MQQFSFLIWLGLSHLSALCYLIMQLHSKNYLFINSAKLLQFDQVSLKFMDSESNISIKPSICLQITFFFSFFLTNPLCTTSTKQQTDTVMPGHHLGTSLSHRDLSAVLVHSLSSFKSRPECFAPRTLLTCLDLGIFHWFMCF